MSAGQRSTKPTAVNEFIQKVRERIEQRNMTVVDLAKKAKVGYPYLYRVLAGTQQPSMRNAEKIGKELGLEIRIVESRKKVSK